MHHPTTALREALHQYEQRTGRCLSFEQCNPTTPANEASYARFRRRVKTPDLGANDGEWIAFRLGIKPIVRETLSPWLASQRIAEHVARGLAVEAVGASKEAGSESAFPRLPGEVGPRGNAVILHIGHDVAQVRRATEVNERLLHRNDAHRERQLIAEHGELLGYPRCCAEAFAGAPKDSREAHALANAAHRSEQFSPLLNVTSLGMFHYVAWIPCAFDCTESLRVARAVHAELPPASRAAIWRILSWPRLWLDERRQLAFEGARGTPSTGVWYHRSWTASALDRFHATAWYDWVFFIDVGYAFSTGHRWTASGPEGAVVESPGGDTFVSLSGRPTWLPFDGNSREPR